MANHKSTKKRIRSSKVRQEGNKYLHKTVRNAMRSALVDTSKEGEKKTIKADTIIPVFPLLKNEALFSALQGKVPEVYAIGACTNPKALIVDAVKEANELASSL